MEMYDVECGCGEIISVGIYKCGSDVPCPKCHKTVRVPDSITLKSQNGDPYPSLRYIEKIRCAMRDSIKPFDGRCMACSSTGTNGIPIAFSELTERFIDDNGGIRVGFTGVKAVVGKAESVFQTTNIPIVLCDQCTKKFEQDRPSRFNLWAKWILLTGIVAGVFQLIFQVWFVTTFATAIVLVYLSQFRETGVGKTSKIPKWLEKWTQFVRWLPEATHDAMEFSITVGKSQPISPQASPGELVGSQVDCNL